MSIEVKRIDMKLNELKQALKPNTQTEVIFITTDNKAVKIQNARLVNYTEVPINVLKKIAD